MKDRPKHILKHKRRTGRVKDSKSLCGKSYYGNSLLSDFTGSNVVCKVCDRISRDCDPIVGCMWSWSWSRDDIAPGKAVRDTALVGNALIVALHSRNLTRVWFKPYPQGKRECSVKFLSQLTKTWVDTQFFRSTTLQEYLNQMLNG